jgi:F420-non-reducing hydrogenase large subunit
MYEMLTGDNSGTKPIHARLATHWARVIELAYAAERALELARDDEVYGDEIRTIPTAKPDEGIGIVEAPRGTLTHHYKTDENGLVTMCNLVVGTTNNHAPISMSIQRAARGLIKKGGEVTDGILNRIEMAFRLYDPCFGCATHSLPGQMPLIVTIRDRTGNVLRELRRD